MMGYRTLVIAMKIKNKQQDDGIDQNECTPRGQDHSFYLCSQKVCDLTHRNVTEILFFKVNKHARVVFTGGIIWGVILPT